MAKPFRVNNVPIVITDASGNIITSGAKLFTYQAGTTTKLTCYGTQSDAINGTNALANPIIASSSGRVNDIWATQACKLVAAPSNDTDPPISAYWTTDNITSLAQSVVHITKTALYTVTASDRDSLIECDASGGSFVINLLSASSAGDGFNLKFQKIDSSSNTVTITCNGADTWNGAGTVILYNQYDYLEGYSDGTKWVQSDNLNVPINGMSQFLGPEYVFAKSAGTWTMTRNAEGNYSTAKTASAETPIIAIDITNHININTNKGFKLSSFSLAYSIGTSNLNAHTVTLDKVSIANNTAVTITSVPITATLATATQTNPYLTSCTVNTPAFNNTANSRYIIEVTLNAAAGTVYNFYGVNLSFIRNDR